jgi:hypothetical protein
VGFTHTTVCFEPTAALGAAVLLAAPILLPLLLSVLLSRPRLITLRLRD